MAGGVRSRTGQRYRALFDSIVIPLYVVDPRTLQFLALNAAAAEQHGFDRAEIPETGLLGVAAPAERDLLAAAIATAVATGTKSAGIWTIAQLGGEGVAAELTVCVVDDPEGDPELLISAQNVSGRLAAVQALEESESRLRGLFEHATEGIYQRGLDHRFIAINPALARMYGYHSPAEMLAETSNGDRTVYVEPDRRKLIKQRLLTEGHVEDFVSECRRRDGATIWVSESARCVRDAAGEVRYYEGFVENITDRRLAEAERERLLSEALATADCDPLTGLLNHRAFHKRLEQELERAQRVGKPIAVFVLDLDNFKFFNDAYGHSAGDAVLRTVAAGLRSCCRSYDVIGRFGGDEFAIVTPESSTESAAGFALRIQTAMQETGYQPDDYDVKIPLGVSVGFALYPDDVPSRSELIELADQRLRRAKLGNEMESVCERVRSNYLSSMPGFKILDALVTAVDNKDRYTRRHSEHVMLHSRQIASQLGLSTTDMDIIELTALLHDVGKIGVPDAILRKPGRLTEEETDAIQQHAVMGAMIVSAVPGFSGTLAGIRHHHERWDGKGYPDHLNGDATPLAARILAVADAYSAMTTNRPYRTGMPAEEALAVLQRGAGSQWDPACVDALLAGLGRAPRETSSAFDAAAQS